MKNTINKYSITVILIGMILVNFSYAQSDISGGGGTGHAGASNTGYYVGWDANTTFDLDIKHLATGANAKNINFYTRATQKMTILGNNGSTDGFVGIGTTSPNYLLTQDGGTGNASYHQFINGATTGTGTNDGFLIGIDGSGNGILNCRGGAPINFLTSGAKRMKIQGGGSLLIGDYSAATAYNQLVQYVGGNVNVYHGFVNGNTGVSNTSGNDGFKIGLTYNSGSSKSDAELISQQSGANMNFYTSNGSTTQRMQIAAGGNVGIGDAAQSSGKLYVKNDYSVSGAPNGIDISSTYSGANNINGLKIQSTGNPSTPYSTSGTDITAYNGYFNVGVTGTASNGISTNYGGSFTANGTANTTGNNVGVYGIAYTANTSTAINIGAAGYVNRSTNTAGTCYGVSGYVNSPQDGDYSGYFTGAGLYVNSLLATAATVQSLYGTGASTALYAVADQGNQDHTAGVFTASTPGNIGTSVGVVASAGGCDVGYGGKFISSSAVTSNYGSYAAVGTPASIPSGANIGGYFYANGNTNTVNVYAVYASVPNGCTATSSTNCNNLAGYFNGAIVTTAGSFTASDAQFKTNVQDVQNALQIIDQLQPKTYAFDQSYIDQINLPEGNHFGFIANDIAPVLPGLVKSVVHPQLKDTLGNPIPAINYSALNYDELIPILTAAIKELKAEVSILQSSAKPSNTGSANQKEVKLSEKPSVILEQNNPNPFKENTTINYNIPDDVKQAQILFYNSKGNVISTVEITEKGAGSLLVYGADLTSGVYTYTLLIDGRVVETKKMMKVK